MLNFYRQLFYKLYCSNMLSWKDKGPAASQALALICMYVCMNIYSIFVIGDLMFGTSLSARIFELDELHYIGLLIIFVVVVWGLFIFNGRYKRIIEECEAGKSERNAIPAYLFRIYEIGSIMSFLCMLVIPSFHA